MKMILRKSYKNNHNFHKNLVNHLFVFTILSRIEVIFGFGNVLIITYICSSHAFC